MNLSSFSADNFEPVNWINESFRQNEDKEKFASDTVLKLQSFIQEINRSLEDSSKKIIVNLGKVKDELHTLNEQAYSLKSNLDHVQSELSKMQIENDTPTMSKLLEINELQSKMQQTSMSLKEADNWSTLNKEMEIVIQTGDLDIIASKLINMQKRSDHIKNLNILASVPDYFERTKKLNEFKSIFIKMINQKLNFLFSDALLTNPISTNDNKQSELEKYIHIFRELDMIDPLKEIHQESICHQLVLEWQKTKNLNSIDTIIDWLNTYFDLLNLALLNQTKIIDLFCDETKESCHILISLFIDLFTKINEDLNKHLNNYIDSKENNFTELINSLIFIKKLVDKLSKNVYNNLIKIDSQINENNSEMKKLFILINTSYKHILQRYFTIEKKVLLLNFNEIQNSQLLSEYVTKVFQICRDCEKRCYLLTNSVYLPKFIDLIGTNFNQSIDYFQSLKNSVRLEENQQTPDWNLFQTVLVYLQSIGDFMVQFDCFRQQIFNSWLDYKHRLDTCQAIVQNFSYLYLDLDDQIVLNSINIKSSDELFVDCLHKLKALSNSILILAFSIPINFVTGHLSQLEITLTQNSCLNFNYHQDNEEVLKLSLTPNEYITQIGQYLLTIPQHIEHLITQENISLKCVFKHFNQKEFLQTNEMRLVNDVAEFFLNVLVDKIVELFFKKIQTLNLNNRKDQLHLIVDCEYLNEVIDDLGLCSHKSLKDLITNLKDNLSSFS